MDAKLGSGCWLELTQANYIPEFDGTSQKMSVCLTQFVEEELFQTEMWKQQKGLACPAKEREDLHYLHDFVFHIFISFSTK